MRMRMRSDSFVESPPPTPNKYVNHVPVDHVWNVRTLHTIALRVSLAAVVHQQINPNPSPPPQPTTISIIIIVMVMMVIHWGWKQLPLPQPATAPALSTIIMFRIRHHFQRHCQRHCQRDGLRSFQLVSDLSHLLRRNQPHVR